MSKARYRRGQAQTGKQNFELGLADLLVVAQLQPTDPAVKKEITLLKKVTKQVRVRTEVALHCSKTKLLF